MFGFSVFRSVGFLFSFLYPFNLLKKILYAYSCFYTGYYKRYFFSFGDNSIIVPSAICFEGLNCISIGDHVRLGKNIQLTAWRKKSHCFPSANSPMITIGDGSEIGSGAHITAVNSIVLGKNVLCGKNVTITDNAHGAIERHQLKMSPIKRAISSKGPVIIGNNVWIGDKSSILPNVRIGEGCIIAANSVVTKNIPPFCIAAGIPAKVIKEVIE